MSDLTINGKKYGTYQSICRTNVNSVYKVYKGKGKFFIAKKVENKDSYERELNAYLHLQKGFCKWKKEREEGGKGEKERKEEKEKRMKGGKKYITELLDYDNEEKILVFKQHYCDVKDVPFHELSLLLVAIHDIAMGIKIIHENNMAHQDIKAGNILYNLKHNKYLITDFDISGLGEELIFASTINVASPETLLNWKSNTTIEKLQRADLFSFGSTLYGIYGRTKGYEISSSISPYTSEKYEEIENLYYGNSMEKITISPEDINKLIPKDNNDETDVAICKVINSLLEFDPEKRMSIQEVLDTIFPSYVKMKPENCKISDNEFFYGK